MFSKLGSVQAAGIDSRQLDKHEYTKNTSNISKISKRKYKCTHQTTFKHSSLDQYTYNL